MDLSLKRPLSPPIACSKPAAIDAVGAQNVMFAVDYPYEQNERAVEFLTTAPVDDDDLARVAHRNADKLLRLTADAPSRP